MKKLFVLFIILHLSFSIFAQSGTMLPDGFIMPNLAVAPGCTVADKGKMYFNTTSKGMMVCNGTAWLPASSQWENNHVLPNTINYSGNVGINTSTPQYPLDINGTARVSSNLYASNGINIGGTSAISGLMMVDGDIAITSTADAKTWKFDYSDANNNLSLQEDGTARMVFANGGNVGIGSGNPTAKLSVEGTGSFTGNLTVNNGKGIVRTTSTASLKTHIVQVSLGTTFVVDPPGIGSGCANTASQSITSAGFSAAPTVQVGNLVSGTGDFGKLIINVQSVTTSAFVLRFCNNTGTQISLSNVLFNILCVGQ
jgi:hypothetical protein